MWGDTSPRVQIPDSPPNSAERRKHPVIENNAENVALLSRLEDLGFVSSKTLEKDGLRVHPKRN